LIFQSETFASTATIGSTVGALTLGALIFDERAAGSRGGGVRKKPGRLGMAGDVALSLPRIKAFG